MFKRKYKNDKKYISITELASLLDMTSETLRYYDRIDLFKPDMIADNQYRYYDILRFDLLGTIKQLRQLGMSIEDIREYYEDKNLKKSYEMLSELYIDLDKRAKELNSLKRVLKRKLDFMEPYVEHGSKKSGAVLKILPQRKIITTGNLVRGLVEYAEETIFLESMLQEVAPMLGTNKEGGLIPLNEEAMEADYGPWVPFLFVDSFKGIPKKYQQYVPEGEYICATYNDYYLRLEEDAIQSILQYAKENGYEITGDIVSCDMLDVTVTDDFTEMVVELQAPVKKI